MLLWFKYCEEKFVLANLANTTVERKKKKTTLKIFIVAFGN